MIITDNVSKTFGKLKAVDGVSFEIQRGEIVGFLGQNGSGKTTLMRMLTTFLTMTSGKAIVAGHDVVRSPMAVRKAIGYLPEKPPLYENMKVLNYLKLAAQLKDVPAQNQKIQIDRVIEDCQLADVRTQTIGTLSKGYKQRVGIAQAIINDPLVLILDEPTSGLDPVQVQAVRALIKKLEKSRTVILSTHILSEIEMLADRVLIIKKGKIVLDQSMQKLLHSDAQYPRCSMHLQGNRDRIWAILDEHCEWFQITSEHQQDESLELEVELKNLTEFNKLLRLLMDNQIDLRMVAPLKIRLEDIFLSVSGPEDN